MPIHEHIVKSFDAIKNSLEWIHTNKSTVHKFRFDQIYIIAIIIDRFIIQIY